MFRTGISRSEHRRADAAYLLLQIAAFKSKKLVVRISAFTFCHDADADFSRIEIIADRLTFIGFSIAIANSGFFEEAFTCLVFSADVSDGVVFVGETHVAAILVLFTHGEVFACG